MSTRCDICYDYSYVQFNCVICHDMKPRKCTLCIESSGYDLECKTEHRSGLMIDEDDMWQCKDCYKPANPCLLCKGTGSRTFCRLCQNKGTVIQICPKCILNGKIKAI